LNLETQDLHHPLPPCQLHSSPLKPSTLLSEIVEPEDLTFANDVDIDVDDGAIFVQADAFDEPDEEGYSRRMEYYDGANSDQLCERRKW
jgi:hypothetical protein